MTKEQLILQERAKKFAGKKAPSIKSGGLTVVEFMLAYELYAIETLYLREVIALKEITPLPGMPDFVLGLINVRGEVLSVLDIKKFFQLPGQQLSDLNKVLIVTNNSITFGILADKVLGIKELGKDAIFNTVINLRDKRDDYLHGITADRQIILDGKKLLNDKKIIIHQEL